MGLQSSGPGKRPSEAQVWSLQPVSSGVVGCAVVVTSGAVPVEVSETTDVVVVVVVGVAALVFV